MTGKANWWPQPNKADGEQLVANLKNASPDLYARWFLLEALGVGLECISKESRDFLRSQTSDRLGVADEMMAARRVIAPAATEFFRRVAANLDETQRHDLLRSLKGAGLLGDPL